MKAVYITRDSYSDYVWVFPATVGIRKFHGCIAWGAAWCETYDAIALSQENRKRAEHLDKHPCKKRFGFYPRAGTAWYINSRGKRSKVDIDFSP